MNLYALRWPTTNVVACLMLIACVYGNPAPVGKSNGATPTNWCHTCATKNIVESWEKVFFFNAHGDSYQRLYEHTETCRHDNFYQDPAGSSLGEYCRGSCFTLNVTYQNEKTNDGFFGTMRGCYPSFFPPDYRLEDPPEKKPFEKWCEWVDHFNPTSFSFHGVLMELKLSKDICFCAGDGCNGRPVPPLVPLREQPIKPEVLDSTEDEHLLDSAADAHQKLSFLGSIADSKDSKPGPSLVKTDQSKSASDLKTVSKDRTLVLVHSRSSSERRTDERHRSSHGCRTSLNLSVFFGAMFVLKMMTA